VADASLNLHARDLVQVRDLDEILATLDGTGSLGALPFMPEMRQFCGRRFRVDKIVTKVCDTIGRSGMHQMDAAVHLEGTRCDGEAHGGCQAGCLLYWKEAWLRRVDSLGSETTPGADRAAGRAAVPHAPGRPVSFTVEDLWAATRRSGGEAGSDGDAAAREQEAVPAYRCQSTELMRAAPCVIASWDARQYVRDVRVGNVGALASVRTVLGGFLNEVQDLTRRFLPRWLRVRGGLRFPVIDGRLTRTPAQRLDLQPGELVRVKSRDDIVATLDTDNLNRGMSFDREMLEYCGRQARVLTRVERILDESTGRMMHLPNPCIVLDGVVCHGTYHRSCPRATYPYWREIWLERVP
jgi:hypothetical protein